MAFENTLQAIAGYNTALKGGQLVDEGHLTFVLQTLFVDIQDQAGGASSLPNGGTTGQVLSKNSNNDGDATWTDALNGDFLPLVGGTMNGDIDMDTFSLLYVESISNSSTSFNINLGMWTSNNDTGLYYNDDYSTNYTNRSLVDKEYVDTAIQAAIDALP